MDLDTQNTPVPEPLYQLVNDEAPEPSLLSPSDSSPAEDATTEISLPRSGQKRLVIIGGGFGGLNIVKKLRGHKDYQVVMIDKNNYHTFQPLMYQIATSGLEVASIVYPLRKFLGKDADFFFRMAEVKKIRPEEHILETSIGNLHYDYLVIASGMTNNFFGMEDVKQNALPLKSISESITMRNTMLLNMEKVIQASHEEERESLLTYVICGGGPTGVELAGAISELRAKVLPGDYPEIDFTRMRIMLIDPGTRLLSAMSEQSGKAAEKYLRGFGVELIIGKGLKSFDGKTATLSDGSTLLTSNLIWAAGVTGSLPEGIDKSMLGKGNRLKVNNYCQVEGLENVFAIGDIASLPTEKYPNGLPGLAPVAIQEGQFLGKHFRRLAEKDKLEPFSYFDKGSLATIGRNKAVADLPGNIHFHGFFAWIIWVVVHIFYLIGFRNKFLVIFDWFRNYLTLDRQNRIIVRPGK